MHKIVSCTAQQDYRMGLRFDDGTEGVVDVSDLAGVGVFSCWDDYSVFTKVTIGSGGELVWDDMVDLCPDALYMRLTGKSAEDFFPSLRGASAHA
jgi:hypothetical protein